MGDRDSFPFLFNSLDDEKRKNRLIFFSTFDSFFHVSLSGAQTRQDHVVRRGSNRKIWWKKKKRKLIFYV